jgi:archaellum biogenesis ATPase FlaH
VNIELSLEELQDFCRLIHQDKKMMTKDQAEELLSAKKSNFNENQILLFQLNQTQEELKETQEKLKTLETLIETQTFCRKDVLIDVITSFVDSDKSETVDYFVISLIKHIRENIK